MFARVLLNVILAAILMTPALAICAQEASGIAKGYQGYAGSVSCIECHEKFYKLWVSSHHGLAMQPYTAELGRKELTPQTDTILIGQYRYRADMGGETGWVVEQGPEGEKKYPMVHALGGKNVYYFLTPLDRGRLQVLPVAYDVRRKEWFDTAASGVRHFPDFPREEPVNWKEWPYTFNTSCYGCHVSQFSTNYDTKTDSYATTWKEPGINCETCHGPSEEHNTAMRALPKGEKLADTTDFKIIRTKKFTPAQHNDACNSCHSKAMPLTASYQTPERFFDHFDLVTLENPDFYPDGRDLGENYTQTSWRMSPCVKSGKLHCITCHTSSGRYRFRKPEDANKACLPCHEERVTNVAAHSHHPAESAASRCIACHMPTTDFARMQRTDHSMLPPTPATTIAYQSPNACNGCHQDRDAAWSDKIVRQWHADEYQTRVLRRAALIDSARKRDWTKLSEMLVFIGNPASDEIFVTSLIRLLAHCDDAAKVPVLLKAAGNASPLVRGAAVEGLGQSPSLQVLQGIAAATGDDYRLVRVRAAAALAQFSNIKPQGKTKEQLSKATDEYLAALMARPDSWHSHYNLGNYYLGQNRPKEAVAEYDEALKREPRAVLALVNASMADARLGETGKAEERLNEALKIAPDSAVARYNLGLLKAEQGDLKGAEKHLKAALKADPQMAQAAYNLCVIISKDRIGEAVAYCKKAVDLRPQDPRYAYTLAFYLLQKGDRKEGTETLQNLIDKQPAYADSYLLLGETLEKQGKKEEAGKLYEKALETDGIPDQAKRRIAAQLEALKEKEGRPGGK